MVDTEKQNNIYKCSAIFNQIQDGCNVLFTLTS